MNPNVTMADVIGNPDKPWNWDLLSYNRNITMEDVIANPDKPWNYSYLCNNPSLFEPTPKEVFDHVRKRRATSVICEAVLRVFTNPSYDFCLRRLDREFQQLTDGGCHWEH
jgi:hypothetical protein